MNNRKEGFTLVEVIVSVILVSVVMTSMLAALVKIRETYDTVHENTDAIIYSSSISRILNKDVSNNGGIRYADCNLEGSSCEILFANNNKRKIVIDSNEEVKEEQKKGSVVLSQSVEIQTTLQYIDITDPSKEKLIYIKTLTLVKNEKFKREKPNSDGTTDYIDEYKLNTYGYRFGRMDTKLFSAPSTRTNYKNVISSINIAIFDGIDESDISNNIVIASSSTYAPTVKYGDDFVITLSDKLNSTIKAIKNDNGRITERYGVSFYERVKTGVDSETRNDKIENIKVPAVTSGDTTLKFNGYWTGYDDATQTVTGTQVIDASGKIIVSNTYFSDNISLYSGWVH